MPHNPHKTTHTKTDTMLITPEVIAGWEAPSFQRPLRVNEKVRTLAEEIKRDQVIPGFLTLGVLGKKTYLIDGQHRVEAFRMADIREAFADVRTHYVETDADMGLEFVRLNSSLVRPRPDDNLRGLEGSLESVALIRKKCPFVGYDYIRRGPTSPVLSMSQVIRNWTSSMPEVPSPGGTSGGVSEMARQLGAEEAENCVGFLTTAFQAWGRDSEYQRIWGALTLALCMWIYRRIVLSAYSPVTTRVDRPQFVKLMMSLTADQLYMDWLVGRLLNDRDRAPGYNRIKAIFARRLFEDTGKKARLPSPAWAHGGGR
jgi:hypothetical protein